MWAKYDVHDELHLYFTGKNALTITLLLYRLYCLNVKDHPVGGSTDRNYPLGGDADENVELHSVVDTSTDK